jgi:succinate dehydrogenase / fumarate reductase membrane anchor subunit
MTYGASARPLGGSRAEVFQWFYFRISGLALVVLAFAHLWLNHIATDVADLDYNLVVSRLAQYPILKVADFMLLFLGLSHGLLGIKNIIDDRVHSRNSRLFWLSFLSVLFTVFLVAGTVVLWTIDTSGGN